MTKSACVFLGFAAALFLAGTARDAADIWIDRTKLPEHQAQTSVEVRDRNGMLLRAYQVDNGIWRLATTPDQVDADFIDMLIRYEDKRFRSHSGVDPFALLRAAGQMLWYQRTVSGGSTLTMQVARLLEDGTTGTWSGKLRQMRVAMALERRLSKDEILSLYLTHAPYGGNLEGLRAASFAWFGKEPRRLRPAEAALLVALPQSPEIRRPDRHPDAARAARNRVLNRMTSYGVLAPPDAKAARAHPVPTTARPFPRLAAHLADEARSSDPLANRHDLTVDARVQRALEKLLAKAARGVGPRVSAALVAADHTTGEIIALVGSPAYDDDTRAGFVDMTRAIRSPGSTLKPLIYGLAFDQGLAHPETLINDGPVAYGTYRPSNFDGAFRGDVRVREALQMSLNIPAVRLMDELGPARLMTALRRAGADPRLPGRGVPGLAIALGGIGLSLRDLTQLYGALARGGQGISLRSRLTEPQSGQARVVSDTAAWQVSNILAGLAPPRGAPAGVIAYKTGTSYGHRDAWAIGFDGRHVVGVWLGRADGTPVPGAFGGDLAAPVLFEAFGRLKPGFDPMPPPPAATLIVVAADLPPPLRRFKPRRSAFDAQGRAVQLAFPPDGSVLRMDGGALTLKLRGGLAPFTVLANGRPVTTGQHLREFDIPFAGTGFSTLVVIDGRGLSDRVTIRLD